MKVILLRDVARIGRKFEVKDVPDGHAQNYLFPRKLAQPATRQNLDQLAARALHQAADAEATEQRFESLTASVAKAPVVMTAGANAKGHLFKGVHAADIAAALSSATGIPVASEAVMLERPLKEVGEHTVTLSTGGKKYTVLITIRGA